MRWEVLAGSLEKKLHKITIEEKEDLLISLKTELLGVINKDTSHIELNIVSNSLL